MNEISSSVDERSEISEKNDRTGSKNLSAGKNLRTCPNMSLLGYNSRKPLQGVFLSAKKYESDTTVWAQIGQVRI